MLFTFFLVTLLANQNHSSTELDPTFDLGVLWHQLLSGCFFPLFWKGAFQNPTYQSECSPVLFVKCDPKYCIKWTLLPQQTSVIWGCGKCVRYNWHLKWKDLFLTHQAFRLAAFCAKAFVSCFFSLLVLVWRLKVRLKAIFILEQCRKNKQGCSITYSSGKESMNHRTLAKTFLVTNANKTGSWPEFIQFNYNVW